MRCKACNAQLLPTEGRWNAELKMHDELCRKCKQAIKGTPLEDTDELPLVLPTTVPKR